MVRRLDSCRTDRLAPFLFTAAVEGKANLGLPTVQFLNVYKYTKLKNWTLGRPVNEANANIYIPTFWQ